MDYSTDSNTALIVDVFWVNLSSLHNEFCTVITTEQLLRNIDASTDISSRCVY